jgi:hypothetical protein
VTEGEAQLREFLERLRDLVSTDVTSEWRALEHSELVYFEAPSDSGDRGIELAFGADECQLSIGTLIDLEFVLSRSSDVERVQRIVVGVVSNGLSVWKSRWRTSVCVGTPDDKAAQAHMRSRSTPLVVTRWEPWVGPAIRSTLAAQFGDNQAVEWL